MVDNESHFHNDQDNKEPGMSEKGRQWLATKFRIKEDAPDIYLGLLVGEALEIGVISQKDLDTLNKGEVPDDPRTNRN